MGLDPSREKLYRLRNNVQDSKGKAAFLHAVREAALILDRLGKHTAESAAWGTQLMHCKNRYKLFLELTKNA